MKRFITIISAGIIALLSFSSCDIDIHWNDNSGSVDATLTCYYAGNLPAETAGQTYKLDDTYLSDYEIEDKFLDLCELVRPGFINAVLEIDIYDSYDHFKKTRIFDFWWEIDPRTGEGYYAWDEIKE
jgi:hypothetical protein